MGRVLRAVGLAVLLLVLGAAPAFAAPNDPPDVRGYPPSDAVKLLQGWAKDVLIKFEPPVEQVDKAIDPASVVVVQSQWVNQANFDSVGRPQFLLTLGSAVPEVRTLPLSLATEVLHSHGLAPETNPAQAEPNWTVSRQRPEPGQLVPFGTPVSLFLDAPVIATNAAPTASPTANDRGRGFRDRPVVVATVVGGSAGLFVLILGVGLGLRRAARRRRLEAGSPNISVQGHPGQVIGPQVAEAGPSLSIRIEPHSDPGTVSLEEVRT
jgi:hypothetical protein